ncbi:MAG: hypothetical protein JRI59_09900 [Deltaproteobacteria bacterium]|nr:hypothetical protein [Deltaproteobacteria bacterium]
MKVSSVLAELQSLGYVPQVQGDKVNLVFRGGTKPPLSQVQPLVAVLKRHKPEVLTYLKGQAQESPARVRCLDCRHADSRAGHIYCRHPEATPAGRPGMALREPHPCDGFTPWPPTPPCTECPWCRTNPWAHDPELPLWCAWWWDFLAWNSGQCRDRREGRVPDPEPGDPRVGPLNLPRPRETTATCFMCAHFQPAEDSPNPTQAWGECTRTGEGRYGVARACDAVRLTGSAKRRRKEMICNQ